MELLKHIIIKKQQLQPWKNTIVETYESWLSDATSIESQTSGSTGSPKKIPHTKAAVLTSAKQTIDYFDIQPNQTALLCLPAQFIGGKMMIIRSLVGNWQLYCCKPSSVIDFKNIYFDFVAMTPHQVISTYKAFGKEVFKQVGTLIIGGGEIPNTELETISKLPCNCFSTYGMTETITHIAVKNISKQEGFFTSLSNIIINTTQDNCLIIEAPYLDSPITTNDVVELTSNNTFIWKGRKDNVINSGGLKLFPEQIEQQLSSVFDFPFFIWQTPDEVLGQKAVLVATKSLSDEMILLINRVLKPTHRPKEWWTVSEFVYTQTDKINRLKTIELVKEKSAINR